VSYDILLEAIRKRRAVWVAAAARGLVGHRSAGGEQLCSALLL